MRKSSKALIALGIGIAVNALVVMGIFAVPCTTASPQTTTDTNQKPSAPPPAFGSLSNCTQAWTAGFIIVGLADVFGVVMVASELAKRS
jgi:hypothetical protein